MSIRSILAKLKSGMWSRTSTAPLELPPAQPPVQPTFDVLADMEKTLDAMENMNINCFPWDRSYVRYLIETIRDMQAEIREIKNRLRFG
jgi:hypothetical protein